MSAPLERAAADTDAENSTLIDKITPAAAAAQVALSGGTFLTLALTVSLNAAVWSLAVTTVAVPLIVHSVLVLRSKGAGPNLRTWTAHARAAASMVVPQGHSTGTPPGKDR